MTEVEDDYDNEEFEELGPSLARPPLYVLRSPGRCTECGRAIHVYSLGCAAFQDAGAGYPIEEFHFLRRITSVPSAVVEMVKAKCPSFYMDKAEDGERPYLMNHCPCGAKLGDNFVSGDVGAAIWPETPEGFAQHRLFRLPVEAEFPVECGCMIDGGD